MPSVDNRVVQMQFDNAAFEKKMGETIASLEKFRQQLDFSKVSGDLGKSLAGTFNGFSTATVTAGIEDVSNRFLALKTVAFTVVSEITQAFIGLGQRLATELLRPDTIVQGFSEYEMKMGSIQTILASSGADLATVNQKLDELNTYSDRTIYSFADMTENIGKFTNAGVGLEESVAAIQGVANVAAVSGANAQEAARSMYNFGQALSSGSVRLEDWRSIELANMGTVEFKQQLIDAAEAMGTLTRQGDGWITASGTFVSATKGFRESLSEQWLTSEVLVDTLNEYADETTDIGKKAFAAAQDVKTFTQLMSTLKESLGSGWSQSFEIIIGNLDEAKALFGSISGAVGGFINRSSDARNELLRGWKDLGGRTLLIESLGSAFNSLGLVLKTIGEAFRSVFPPATAQTLMALTEGFARFVARLKPSESTLENIKQLFTGLFNVVKLFVTIGGGLVKLFASIFGTLSKGSGGLFAILGGFGRLLTFLTTDILSSDRIAKVFEGMGVAFAKVRAALQPFINILGMLLGYLGNLVSKVGPQVGNVVNGVFGRIPAIFDKIIASVYGFGTELETAFRNLFASEGGGGGGGGGGLFGGIADSLEASWETLVQAFESLDFSGFSGITGRIRDRLASISEPLTKTFQFFVDAISGIAEGIGKAGTWIADAFGTLTEKLSSVFGSGDFSGVVDLVNTLLIGAAGGGLLYFLRKFANEGVKLDLTGGLLEPLNGVLDELTGTLKAMQLSLKADALMKIASAVGILAASMLVLALIDSAALTRALAAMTVGFANLVGTLVVLDKATSLSGTGGLVGTSFAMNLIATSLILLAGSVALFGTMDIDTLAKGITSMTVVLAAIVAFSRLLQANQDAFAQASKSLVPFGVGLLILSKAVKKFSDFDPVELVMGLAGMGLALLILAKTINAMPENLAAQGAGIILVGIGLNIIAMAVQRFADMSILGMLQGLVGVALAMQAIAKAVKLMPTAGMIQMGVGLIAVGFALNLIARAVGKIGEMGLAQLIQGIAGLILILAPLAIALQLMQGTIAGSGALLIAAFALSIFAGVVRTFAALKIGELAMGLLGIVAVLAVIALASLAIAPAVPAILALGAAMLLLGAGFALIGAAAYLTASALVLFSKVGPKAFENILKAARTFVQVLPSLLAGIAQGILAFVQVFLDAAPGMIEAIGGILTALLDQFIKIIPKILTIVGLWIAGIIDIIRESGPDLIAAGFELLMAWLTGLRDNMNEITTVIGEIIIEFLTALTAKLPEINAAGVALILEFLNGLRESIAEISPAVLALILELLAQLAINYPKIVQAGAEVLAAMLRGIAGAIATIAPAARELIEELASQLGKNVGALGGAAMTIMIELITSIGRNFWRLAKAGKDLILEFMEAATDNITELAKGAFTIMTDFLRELRGVIDEKLPEFRDEGVRLIGALINGMTFGIPEKAGQLLGAVGDLAGKVITGFTQPWKIFSPSRVTYELGMYLAEGAANGIIDGTSIATAASRSLAKNVTDAMELALADNRPVITPVLDLSVLQADLRRVDAMLPVSSSSYQSAATIADYTTQAFGNDEVTLAGASEVVFNQTINAPKQLSTAEIYRQTRSQLALAKQELSIR